MAVVLGIATSGKQLFLILECNINTRLWNVWLNERGRRGLTIYPEKSAYLINTHRIQTALFRSSALSFLFCCCKNTDKGHEDQFLRCKTAYDAEGAGASAIFEYGWVLCRSEDEKNVREGIKLLKALSRRHLQRMARLLVVRIPNIWMIWRRPGTLRIRKDFPTEI